MFLILGLVCNTFSCGTTGTGPSVPSGLSHGGTGPFRALDVTEIPNITPNPAGKAHTFDGAVESGMVAKGYLFYSGSLARNDAQPSPEGSKVIDWDQFELRSIYRSAPTTDKSFMGGSVILGPTQSWEDDLREPWVLEVDNKVILFYASRGGIGAAVASSVDSVFVKRESNPVIAKSPSEMTLSRPTAVFFKGKVLLYADKGGGRFVVFSSTDGGNTFDAGTNIDLGVVKPSLETGILHPAAVVATTSIGRSLVRVYFESLWSDGSRRIVMAGSEDGVNFERGEIPVLRSEEVNKAYPSPLYVNPTTTLMYLWAPSALSRSATLQQGALVAMVSPASVRMTPAATP